ncbi:hypothetical protein [Pelagibius sp.]|uniref:hypothetical protein n=1 Tax=Pelagibius sp. TaxID=1931238 RepID=UPI00261CF818|nr:hypothetical protein [Pelagibius sp.]
MLRQLLGPFAGAAAWHLAPMGYRREISGIAGRAAQCRESWHPHLEATKQVIETAAQACARRKTVLLVGSGLLLDVPLAHLSRSFERVILADIVHPRHTRKQARGYGNVELVQVDITDIARPVFDYVRKGRRGALPHGNPDHFLDQDIDLVASVNLLSQLAFIPCSYLRAKRPSLPRDDLERFERQIVETHLRWLARFAGRVALITDYKREEQGSDGTLCRKNILGGLVLPPFEESWTWRIAPRGTVFHDLDVRHKVAAYSDFPKQHFAAAAAG